MSRRRYPKAEATLKEGGSDWTRLLASSLQVDEQGGGSFELSRGVLEGVTITVAAEEVSFKGLSAEQERLLGSHCQALAKRLGRRVTLG